MTIEPIRMSRLLRWLPAACLAAGTLLLSPPTHSADEDYMPEPYVKLKHPDWSRDAVLYQINTRQFTPEGTFAAAEKHLPRLQALGVDILWLMPVQPIGEKNRKGSLGSPYSIRDYRGVNPEFGDLDDLKRFIAAAHQQGFHVILDWVANHTAWDNPLVAEHPEWYARNWNGELYPPPWTDWSDVVTLDYDDPGLRRYMAEAMKWWVAEVGFDGFRCDVAGFVPLDFWETVRRELDAIRPVFMLAEWEQRDLHARAFDATYTWGFWNTLHDIAHGRADVGALTGYYYEKNNSWPRDGLRMTFVSNHDKNAWDGTQFEAFGAALESAIVLSFASDGIPLIYNGQEAGNPKRLAFFEKDPIDWREHAVGTLYGRLIQLKKANSALWNGAWGAAMIQVPNSAPAAVFSFVRTNEKHGVFAVFNFSAAAQRARFTDAAFVGDYRDFATGDALSLDTDTELSLPAWGYRLFVR